MLLFGVSARCRRGGSYFLLWCCLGWGCFAGTSVQAWEKIRPELEAYVEKAQKDWKVPGFSMAVYIDGHIHFVNRGVQDLWRSTPVTEATNFSIMSCSKVVTVLTVHRLAEMGKLSLEDKVVDILPWFALSDPAETQKVRVKHLLAHCIGLEPFSGDTLWFLDFSAREIFQKLATLPLKHPVGEHYAYQNMFVGLAGILVEKVTGEPLGEVVKRLIFEPLGMTDSSVGAYPTGFWGRLWARVKGIFKRDPRKNLALRAVGHMHLDGKIQPTLSKEQYILNGTSGVNSTTRDFVKLLACLANGGVIQDGPHKGQRLISEDTWRWISSAQIRIPSIRESNVQFPVRRMVEGSLYYGNGMFGWDHKLTGKSERILYHLGSGSGWRSCWGVVPGARLGLVVFSNLGSVNTSMFPEVVTFKTLDLFFGLPSINWHQDTFEVHTRYHQSIDEPFESFVLGAPLSADHVVGVYQHPFYGTAKLASHGDHLYLQYRHRKVRLQHLGGSVYTFPSHDLITHYGDDEPGQLTLHYSKKKGAVVGFDVNHFREGQGPFKRISEKER